MWNPPIVLTLEEQKIVARTRKTRKFFGSLVFSGVQNYCIIKYLSQHIDMPTS